MDFDDDDDEFDYLHEHNDDIEHNLELAQQFPLVDEDEEMEELQIYQDTKLTDHETRAPKHPPSNDAVSVIRTTKAASNASSVPLSCLGLGEPELMYHSPEKEPPLPPFQSPELQWLPSPQPIQSPESKSIPSSPPTPIQYTEQQPIPLPPPPPIQSAEQQPIPLEPPPPIQSTEQQPIPLQPPPPIQSTEQQPIPLQPPPPIQSPEQQPIPSRPPLPLQCPEFQSFPSPPLVQTPVPNSFQTLDSNIQKINDLLKTVPFLKIPLHFGFEINRNHNLASDGSDVIEVFYTHKSQDNETPVILKSAEDIHDYLFQNKIRIPISFFTFEPDIEVCYLYDQPFWAEIIHKEDLSEGMEKVPIPVICAKKSVPGKLAKYATESVSSKSLKEVKIDDDDGFLLCCDCENDCKDKMNCSCFLKTLDNCSIKTREFEGDENIGYKYQRLEKSQISGIFECNRKCKCRTDTCMNRVSQNGLICKLQLFMTDLKGWGVRTLCDIPKGTYITNYVGEIVSGEFANGVTQKWDDGKWKYLSILEVTHDIKEGYESDVVEPEDPPLPLSESEGSTETAAPCLSKEEWNTFMSAEDDCSSSPPDLDRFSRPSSPATSCFFTQSVFLDDNDEENENNETTPTSAPEVNVNITDFPKILRRGRKRVLGPSKADRVLRSDDQFEETPKEFENLITGRFECSQRSLADNDCIELLNQRSINISECVASNKFKRRRKITNFIVLDEFNKSIQLEKMKNQRKRESVRRKGLLKRCTRLSAQYVTDKVLPSVKQKLKENNFMEVTTTPSSPCASPFAFLVPSAQPPSCKLISFDETKNINRGISMGKAIKRGADIKKIIHKARKGWGGSRRRKGGDFKKSVKKNKYVVKGKSKLAEDHPLLQLSFNIDGIDIGNVGRYFNHSCNPNVFPQYVFTNSHDLRFPGIAFFAKRNIKAGEELTWDYGYDLEEYDEDDVKKEEDGSDQKNQEQGAGTENEDAQKDEKTDKDDRSVVMSMSVEALSYKRLDTPLIRKLSGMKTTSGARNKRKPFKRQRTRLPCYCGQDNCIGRLC